VITLIGENLSGNTPDVAQLQQWVQAFGLTHPVVADANWGVTVDYAGYSFGLPSMNLLAPGAVVLHRNTRVTEQQIVNGLP
jgi:hypothetical protein